MPRRIVVATLGVIAVLMMTTLALAALAFVLPVQEGNLFEGLYVPDREIGWIMRPSFRGANFTDSHGARVAAPAAPHPEHVGLLSIGDSQTFGAGVPASETFTAGVQRLTGLSAVNYGVSGYSGVQSLLLLRRHLSDQPRFVVYGFWFDHLNRNLISCAENSSLFCLERPVVRIRNGAPRVELPSGPVRLGGSAGRLAHRLLVPLAIVRGVVQQHALPAADQRIAAGYVLREMATAARSAGARLIVVWIPNYRGSGIPPMPPWLREVAHSADFALIDVRPGLARLQREGADIELTRGPFVGHLSIAAHQAIAVEIAAAIRSMEAASVRTPSK